MERPRAPYRRKPKNREVWSEKTKEVLLYLPSRLGQCEGRKKLMKLMFLVEHFDPGLGRLVRKSLLGDSFLIYHYGVFSFEVMNCYNELVKEGKIREGPGGLESSPVCRGISLGSPEKRGGSDLKLELGEKLRERVDGVIERFGNLTGYELEVQTLKTLGISEKDRYFGRPVESIIR